MGLQAGHSRHERAYARGNADRDGEYVINHESGGGQEACRDAEVLARDGVGASAAGIGMDRLPVRKINDREQDDDAHADGNYVSDSRRAKRNQQSKSGFGTVGRGAQRVQSKNGDAGGGADALGARFVRGERLANEQIENGHEGILL